MNTIASPITPTGRSLAERMFPTLTAAQIARVVRYGRRRPMQHGEVLFDAGRSAVPFFVITSGQVEIIRRTREGEGLVALHGPGQFTGEVNMISGRRSLARARVIESGELIELERDQLMALVQTDAEISEILMRAFILRRVELIAHGLGDAIVIGSNHSAGTLRVKEFLTRNGHPYTYVDLDQDADAQHLLDRFNVNATDVPVLICRCEVVLRNPSNRTIAECLGLNEALDATQVRDLVVVGAGPAGLAAAVYAASEGLDVVVIETSSPGGQAASSSKIENYLGFPTGISGQALAGRAYTQAQKFGAHVRVAQPAVGLICERKPYAIDLGEGALVHSRTVVIATGAEYRRLPIENLSRFEGVGVYYGATFMEAQMCADEDVVVVGGGNSAGQAAVFLAQTARKVCVLVRSAGLSQSMSRYLIRRIEEHPAIELRTQTEVVGLEGEGHLERMIWRNRDGALGSHAIRHLFIMTGANPATRWLNGCVTLDEKGFIKTGSELSPQELERVRWPLERAPYLLETSLPGVFAVGDVRSGNVKRVASAVGEGSIAVSFVHRVLSE